MDDVKAFIKRRISEGASAADVKAELVKEGWRTENIEKLMGEVLSSPAGNSRTVVPVPPSMIEIFLGAASLSLLWTVTFALGALYFQIINKTFPDALTETRTSFFYFFSSPASDVLIRSSIATLIIMFPLYCAAVIYLFRRYSAQPDKRESRLIKWLTYIVLYSAASTAAWDLVSMLRDFLEGELGARAFLRALTVLVISALVIVFYLFERKKVEFGVPVRTVVFWIVGGITVVLVLLGIILGFVYASSPGTERNHKFDTTRASNLRSIQSAIELYGSSHKALPADLGVFKTESGYTYYYQYSLDPETKKQYEYSIIDAGSVSGQATYKLCANFALAADESTGQNSYDYYYGYSDWSTHEKGRVCKEKTVKIFTPPATSTPPVIYQYRY